MEFQAGIIKLIQSVSCPALDYFFIFITNFGSEGFYFVIIPIFYWSIDKKMGIKLGTALLLSMFLNVVIKEITAVPRPIGYPGIRSIYTSSAGGYSFPSGHAQGSTTVWGIIMAYYKKTPVYILGTTMIFLVSLSRLYLGLHWPQDIVAGIILGFIVVSAAFSAGKFRLPESVGLKCTIALAAPAAMLAVFPHPDVFKYTGMLSAAWLGYILDNHFVVYEPKNSGLAKTTAKYVIGVIGFLLLYVGPKLVLPEANVSAMARYFLLGLWLTLGAPYLFKRLQI